MSCFAESILFCDKDSANRGHKATLLTFTDVQPIFNFFVTEGESSS